MMYPISILLITFNRPLHTQKILESIAKSHPQDLFIFQDGPREGNNSDIEKCGQVRSIIDEFTENTGITVHKFFSEKNYGCGAGPMTAISWFFSQVDEGIVMEDDCLPNPDFFEYCSELLEKYRNEERVMYISSTLYDDKWKCEASYDFSHYMITGAWASWARAWKGFNLDLLELDAKQFRRHCRKLLYSPVEADWWYFKTLEIQRDKSKKSYWDYQMQIHLFRNNGLTIHPQKNLISNIGFDEAGTHTLSNDGRGNLPTHSILPLSHPEKISVDTERDYNCFAKTHSQGWLKDTISVVYQTMLFNQGLAHKLLMAYKKIKNGKTNPKVLSVCTSAYSGGAARAAFRIHQGVNALGGDSTMFVKGKGNIEDKVIGLDEFIPDNLVFKAGDWAANKIKNKWQHYQWRDYKDRPQVYLSDLRSTNLHNALKKIDFDVLHLHWINERFFPIELLKDLHKPIVWTLHDSWPFCGVCHYFLDCEGYKKECGKCPMLGSSRTNDLSHKVWEKKRKYFEGLDLHIVSPSNWLANCAKESSLFKDFPVTVIPNCIDTTVFRPMGENEISPKWRNFKEKRLGKNFVLYGAMNAATDKRKGFSSLLSALQILEKSGRANNLELIVYGEPKGLGEINLSIPVHNAGVISNTEELVSLYNIADVTVVPSLTENLSCTIMESLSCGTPAATFDIGGNGDMIEHTQNGYLAKKKDDNDLADGIIWCINNKDKLTDNSLAKVKDCYTIETVCKQYINLYASIL